MDQNRNDKRQLVDLPFASSLSGVWFCCMNFQISLTSWEVTWCCCSACHIFTLTLAIWCFNSLCWSSIPRHPMIIGAPPSLFWRNQHLVHVYLEIVGPRKTGVSTMRAALGWPFLMMCQQCEIRGHQSKLHSFTLVLETLVHGAKSNVSVDLGWQTILFLISLV